MDEQGKEVEGVNIKKVWREAFEKLGTKEGGQESFDEVFAETI